MNITDQEMSAMVDCKTEHEWNDLCSKMKAARDGQYPSDWYVKIIATGFINAKAESFNIHPGITVSAL